MTLNPYNLDGNTPNVGIELFQVVQQYCPIETYEIFVDNGNEVTPTQFQNTIVIGANYFTVFLKPEYANV